MPDSDFRKVAHELAALLEELERVLAKVQLLRAGTWYSKQPRNDKDKIMITIMIVLMMI